MKKGELIDALNRIDGDFEIILANDEEGNSFDSLNDVEHTYYDPQKKRVMHPDDWPDGAKPNAICLWG